jgi:two-component system, NarL family, sensor kinase
MFGIKRIALFYTILLSSWYTPVIAQGDIFSRMEKRKDSALENLKKYPQPDTHRIKALQTVLDAAVFLRQKKQVLPYFEEAIALSRQLQFNRGLAACYIWKGEFHKSSQQNTEAHVQFDSAIALASTNNDEYLQEKSAQALRQKGNIYYEQDNYYPALQYYFESLNYYEAHPDFNTTALLTNITSIYTRLNNYDKAIEYGTKNVLVSEKLGKKMMVAQAQLGLVNIYVKKSDLTAATAMLNEIEPLMPDSMELLLNTAYYDKRGTIAYQQKKYDSSYYYYQKALYYSEKTGHSINVNVSLYHLSDNALKLGWIDLARKYAFQNKELADKIGTPGVRLAALLNLAAYYKKTGNSPQGYDLLQNAMELKDSIISETNIKQVNTLGALYELGKNQKEIAQLQNEKKIQTIELRQKSNWNIFLAVAFIGLLILGLLVYQNIKKNQQLSAQQQKLQQQQIAELEKDKQLLTIDAMLKGQEEERNRIAKDLHDGLGGMLSGVKLSFINMRENMILTPENVTSFERSIELLDNTITELRKVAHNLMPEALVKFGLDEALKDFCNTIATAGQVKVIYQQFGGNRKLTNTAEVFIYRIIQELVNNALKYAAAKLIMVQMTKYENKISITVEDDGKGFDVNKLETLKGAGFSNIRYRVNYFNGTIDIVSGQGEGTSVNIELLT